MFPIRNAGRIGTVLGLVLCSLTTWQQASAQTAPDAQPAACLAAEQGLDTYERCALLLESGRLRRGAEREVVATRGLLHPVALSRAVIGDSARNHALVYERAQRQTTFLAVAATTLGIAAIAVASNEKCERNSLTGGCTNRDNRFTPVVGAMGIAAGFCILIRQPLLVRAQREGALAVWWNNFRLAR